MIALFTSIVLATAAAPGGWTCDAGAYGDNACDCGCGVDDSDCASANFGACDVDNCAPGQAPWEHQNSSCMTSTCGDGWHAADEACDDFDALASGGCNADCTAVTPGYACGNNADGCVPTAGEGEGEGEGQGNPNDTEGGDDRGGDDSDDARDGCAATPGITSALLLLPLLRRLRRRR